MIILTIKTDEPLAEVSLHEDKKTLVEIKWQAHRELADTIHKKIKKLLDDSGHDWTNIDSLVVFVGPGSFTGLRIGVAVANALISSLPCAGVGTTGKDWINIGIDKLLAGENEKLIKPEYGAEANITKPKH